MEDTNQSFRHLFSFGGATDTPVPHEPAKTEPAQPAPKPVRPRSPTAAPDVTQEPERRHDNLSDPEDDPDEVLAKARRFCRGEKDVEDLRHEWFEEGRQDRLRADFKANRRRRAKGRQLGSKATGKPD